MRKQTHWRLSLLKAGCLPSLWQCLSQHLQKAKHQAGFELRSLGTPSPLGLRTQTQMNAAALQPPHLAVPLHLAPPAQPLQTLLGLRPPLRLQPPCEA